MTTKRRFLLFLGDILAIAGAFFAVIWLRSILVIGNPIPIEKFIGPFSTLLIVWLVVLFIFNLYEIEYTKPNPRNVGVLALASGLNIILGSLVFYFFPSSNLTPKLSLLLSGVLAFLFLIIWRRSFYKIFSSLSVIRMFVVGTGPSIDQFISEVKRNKIIGRILMTFENLDSAKIMSAKEEFGSPDIIVSETSEPEKLVQITRGLDSKFMSIENAYEELFGKIPLLHVSNSLAIRLASKETGLANWFFKNIFDRLVAIFILIVSSPVLLLASIAILIQDGGPIIYSQDRSGKGLKTFKLYKLRSMKKDAEKNGVQWAEEKDPRITFVGRFLRKTHIDEIPQMWNILRGDLSLIGPRPERPEFVSKLETDIPFYFLRHTIKPGFTGWAQIKFRYARTIDDSREKFEYDLYYLKNRGLIFDIGILLKTVQIIFTH